MDRKSYRSVFLEDITKADGGVCTSIAEYKDMQFGIPLRHYAQQYLYGSTGLRFGTIYALSGPPQSCKSPYVFDLMFQNNADKDSGGCEGMSFLYEMEGKLSPSLLASMAAWYGQGTGKGTPFQIVNNSTLEMTNKHMITKVIPRLRDAPVKSMPPIIVDWDSVGGAATDSVSEAIEDAGYVGKGFQEKTHIMKNFCENWSNTSRFLPIVLILVNQEKVDMNQAPGSFVQKKHITGGESQIYKAGHILSFWQRQIPAGKVVTIKTTKTSFCDPRQLDVNFVWDQAGKLETDAQGHHWEWAKASAMVLAKPSYIGSADGNSIRDIADVKVSGEGKVTCPQLGCKSVTPEDFEAALFDPANSKILDALYAFQKIEKLKGMDEFAEYLTKHEGDVKEAKEAAKEAAKQEREQKKAAEAAALEAKEERKQARLAKLEAKKAKEPVNAKINNVFTQGSKEDGKS